jgi:hypothetical protein
MKIFSKNDRFALPDYTIYMRAVDSLQKEGSSTFCIILYIPCNQQLSTSGTIDDMDAYDEPYSTKNNSLFMFYNTYGYDVDYLQRIRTFGDFTVRGSTLMLTVYKSRGSDFDIYE